MNPGAGKGELLQKGGDEPHPGADLQRLGEYVGKTKSSNILHSFGERGESEGGQEAAKHLF